MPDLTFPEMLLKLTAGPSLHNPVSGYFELLPDFYQNKNLRTWQALQPIETEFIKSP